jgi:hypothetical protein
MVETRVAPRFRVLKPAKIESNGLNIPCTIRDLSVTGARVEVSDLDVKIVPPTFDLIVPEDGLTLTCRVVWRNAFRVGVEFV